MMMNDCEGAGGRGGVNSGSFGAGGCEAVKGHIADGATSGGGDRKSSTRSSLERSSSGAAGSSCNSRNGPSWYGGCGLRRCSRLSCGGAQAMRVVMVLILLCFSLPPPLPQPITPAPAPTLISVECADNSSGTGHIALHLLLQGGARNTGRSQGWWAWLRTAPWIMPSLGVAAAAADYSALPAELKPDQAHFDAAVGVAHLIWLDLDYESRPSNILILDDGCFNHTYSSVGGGGGLPYSTAAIFFDGQYCCAAMPNGLSYNGWDPDPAAAFSIVWIGRIQSDTLAIDQWMFSLGLYGSDNGGGGLLMSTRRVATGMAGEGYGIDEELGGVDAAPLRPPTNEWTMEVLVREAGGESASYHRCSQGSCLATRRLASSPQRVGGFGLAIGGDCGRGRAYDKRTLLNGQVAVLLLYSRALTDDDVRQLSDFYRPRFGFSTSLALPPPPSPPSSPLPQPPPPFPIPPPPSPPLFSSLPPPPRPPSPSPPSLPPPPHTWSPPPLRTNASLSSPPPSPPSTVLSLPPLPQLAATPVPGTSPMQSPPRATTVAPPPLLQQGQPPTQGQLTPAQQPSPAPRPSSPLTLPPQLQTPAQPPRTTTAPPSQSPQLLLPRQLPSPPTATAPRPLQALPPHLAPSPEPPPLTASPPSALLLQPGSAPALQRPDTSSAPSPPPCCTGAPPPRTAPSVLSPPTYSPRVEPLQHPQVKPPPPSPAPPPQPAFRPPPPPPSPRPRALSWPPPSTSFSPLFPTPPMPNPLPQPAPSWAPSKPTPVTSPLLRVPSQLSDTFDSAAAVLWATWIVRRPDPLMASQQYGTDVVGDGGGNTGGDSDGGDSGGRNRTALLHEQFPDAADVRLVSVNLSVPAVRLLGQDDCTEDLARGLQEQLSYSLQQRGLRDIAHGVQVNCSTAVDSSVNSNTGGGSGDSNSNASNVAESGGRHRRLLPRTLQHVSPGSDSGGGASAAACTQLLDGSGSGTGVDSFGATLWVTVALAAPSNADGVTAVLPAETSSSSVGAYDDGSSSSSRSGVEDTDLAGLMHDSLSTWAGARSDSAVVCVPSMAMYDVTVQARVTYRAPLSDTGKEVYMDACGTTPYTAAVLDPPNAEGSPSTSDPSSSSAPSVGLLTVAVAPSPLQHLSSTQSYKLGLDGAAACGVEEKGPSGSGGGGLSSGGGSGKAPGGGQGPAAASSSSRGGASPRAAEVAGIAVGGIVGALMLLTAVAAFGFFAVRRQRDRVMRFFNAPWEIRPSPPPSPTQAAGRGTSMAGAVPSPPPPLQEHASQGSRVLKWHHRLSLWWPQRSRSGTYQVHPALLRGATRGSQRPPSPPQRGSGQMTLGESSRAWNAPCLPPLETASSVPAAGLPYAAVKSMLATAPSEPFLLQGPGCEIGIPWRPPAPPPAAGGDGAPGAAGVGDGGSRRWRFAPEAMAAGRDGMEGRPSAPGGLSPETPDGPSPEVPQPEGTAPPPPLPGPLAAHEVTTTPAAPPAAPSAPASPQEPPAAATANE